MIPTFIGACLAVLLGIVSVGLAITDKTGPLRITAAVAAVGCFTAFSAYLAVAIGSEGMQLASEACEENSGCELNALGSSIPSNEAKNNVVFAGPFLAIISGILFSASAGLAFKHHAASADAIEPYGGAY